MRDDTEPSKEIGPLQQMRATLSLVGLSADGSRFLMRNEFDRQDGELAARVTSAGGWLALSTRRLIAPPDPLLEALKELAKEEDFQVVPSSHGQGCEKCLAAGIPASRHASIEIREACCPRITCPLGAMAPMKEKVSCTRFVTDAGPAHRRFRPLAAALGSVDTPPQIGRR